MSAYQFDVDQYYSPHEPEHHWALRRKFMVQNMGRFPEERMVCLAQTFANIEFMGCRYPKETMDLVEELAFGVVQEYRESQKGRLKRTFVSGSDAAGAKVNRGQKKEYPGNPSPNKRFRPDPHPEVPENHGPEWNRMILVRLDWDDNDNPCGILNRSASFCQTQSQWEYVKENPSSTTCVVKFGGVEITRATGSTKNEARDEATTQAVNLMAQKCFTIRVRNRFCSDGKTVDLTDLDNTSNEKSGIVKENVGHKLLKLMGWSGGGLGKDGSGIAEPITAASMNHGEGFGAQSASKQFKKRIQAIIEDFAKSNSPYDLVFTTGFTNDQRKEMHQIARRMGLKSKSLGKGADRFLTISKKFSCQDIVRELVAKGGQTDKYTLTPPSNPS